MSDAASKSSAEKTEFGPGKTPLYYNNVGLFSDPFLEERLACLEKYYTHPSTRFLSDYWNIDEFEADKFNKAFNDIMDLWNKLDQDVPKYCDKERQLQNTWIDKIFKALGWEIELEETVSRHGKNNYPDYGLYRNVDDWKKSKTLKGNNKFKKALAVADAKDWGVNLDGKGFSNKNPSFQIINYLKQTDKQWGILTDGHYWRIYSVRSESKHTTYYEIDLIKILAAGDYERFKYFYNFFRVEAFCQDSKLSDRCFLDFVFEDGKFYSQRVEQNLNKRVYRVVDSICKGFLKNHKHPSEDVLKEVYEYSMYYLFKLMFVLNCESKGLLEVNKQDDYYESSLRKKCMEIKEQFEENKNWSQQPRTYNYISDLFELLKNGDKSIGVHGFGSEPFEIGSEQFYSKNKITDELLNTALLELSCDYDEDDNLQFIDYKILSPDHLGSLFEGLLEFSLVSNGKEIELVNTKGDRKSTGSYYTPDYLVNHIVEETLCKLVKGKSPVEITKLKILDPSMGSGHFLLGIVKYLENSIVEIQDSDKKICGAIEFDKIRKEVLHCCVFGVDINPLATQLSKFSLWIYTSQKGDELEPLSDQLIAADSLSDSLDWDTNFGGQIKNGLFDVVIGNPPYVGESGNKELFRKIKKTNIGERFYQGKMDLLYLFMHLGLDHLKDGGVLSFITTNYYFSADGAFKLRADLKKRSTINKIINFNEFKIFKGAQGQHNAITMLSNEKRINHSCEIINYIGKGAFNEKLLHGEGNVEIFTQKIESSKLFYGEDNFIKVNASMSGNEDQAILNKMQNFQFKVSDFFYVNQGIVTGINRIGKKHLQKYSNLDLTQNEGVFILDGSEADYLINDKPSRKHMKPLFKNTDINRFSVSTETDKYLIYTTPDVCAHEKLPVKIKTHLNKFMQIIDNTVDNPPYLHRSRETKIFSAEKIVVPYRSKQNIFGYSDSDWYAAQDVYFITSKNSDFPLKALLALANSAPYMTWLWNMGKRKGNMLELMNTPLMNLPLPRLTSVQLQKLVKKSDELISKGTVGKRELSSLNMLVEGIFESIDEDSNKFSKPA